MSLCFLVFSGPLTTYLTNFDVSNPAATAEHTALVSVFYIPFYIMVAVLAAVGFVMLLQPRLKAVKTAGGTIPALLLVLPLWGAVANYDAVDMSEQRYSDHYVAQIFETVKPRGILFAHWDPFYFPLNYHQYVLGQRKDLIAIDQQLLRRSWYIQWMRDHYPAYMATVRPAVNAFLKAVAPFENKQAFDGNVIQRYYLAMLNAMVDQAMAEGRPVYFTYRPERGFADRYVLEPQPAAFRLRENSPSTALTPIDPVSYSYRIYRENSAVADRMVPVFQKYYRDLVLQRALAEEKSGQLEKSRDFFRMLEDLSQDQPKMLEQIRQKLAQLDARLNDGPRE